jgi:hypothetical protein
VELEKSRGFNVGEAESILSQAEDAFNSGDYSKATDLAEEAKSKAESIGMEASAATTAVNKAESIIFHERHRGFNVSEAESILSQAEDAFNSGDYSRASELADQAKPIALDIDGDGTPNNADFAPDINNYLIYAGVAFLVGLVVVSIAGLKIREGRRLERQRREEERRRIEEEEKQRKEKMKQDILDVIEEVTRGEK